MRRRPSRSMLGVSRPLPLEVGVCETMAGDFFACCRTLASNLRVRTASSHLATADSLPPAECIVYTWDYRSSASIWASLRVQPILSDEVQTFKGLITVHKILQEGHPIVRSAFLSFPVSTPPHPQVEKMDVYVCCAHTDS